MADEYVYGAQEAVTFIDGKQISVHLDEAWDANDPAVKARPDLFRGHVDPDKLRGSTNKPKSAAKKPPARKAARRG